MNADTHSDPVRASRVFISSSTDEMKLYRTQAIRAIKDIGMKHTSYDDPSGIGISHRYKDIFDMNKETIHQHDVFVGLYGFGGVWRPASHVRLTALYPDLLRDPDKMIMEYEYEWAHDADLIILPFVCTEKTTGIPAIDMDYRMHDFRFKIMTRNVGWLTTPDAFYGQIIAKLRAIAPTIFLSYSRKDEEYVKALQHNLRGQDIFSWRDKTHIGGSIEWEKALGAAINDLKGLIVVVTSNAIRSEWVEKECKQFASKGKPVFPYLADSHCKDNLPDYLREIQYIDGTASDGFDTLIRDLRGVLEI
jgi:TIR domain-containing protein/uncharacterized protein DUF4062